MKRGRQHTAAHRRDSASRFDPIHLAMEMDPIFDVQPLIKVDQVRATAQQHVLTVVDSGAVFIGSIQRIRSSPATEKWSRFKDCNSMAGGAYCQRGGETSQTASYNRYIRLRRKSV